MDFLEKSLGQIIVMCSATYLDLQQGRSFRYSSIEMVLGMVGTPSIGRAFGAHKYDSTRHSGALLGVRYFFFFYFSSSGASPFLILSHGPPQCLPESFEKPRVSCYDSCIVINRFEKCLWRSSEYNRSDRHSSTPAYSRLELGAARSGYRPIEAFVDHGAESDSSFIKQTTSVSLSVLSRLRKEQFKRSIHPFRISVVLKGRYTQALHI